MKSNLLRVDREAGMVYGVKFLGNVSQNGRDYPFDVRRESVGLYENARVNLDHPAGRNLERRLGDWIGTLEGVEARQDGNYGNLRLRKKHPDFEAICEAAEEFPNLFGLSPVHDVDWEWHNGVQRAKRINEVISVDFVTEPATTAGIFESRAAGHSPLAAELSARLDRLQRHVAAVESRNRAVESGRALSKADLEAGRLLFIEAMQRRDA